MSEIKSTGARKANAKPPRPTPTSSRNRPTASR